jgi:hypothetical protein
MKVYRGDDDLNNKGVEKSLKARRYEGVEDTVPRILPGKPTQAYRCSTFFYSGQFESR